MNVQCLYNRNVSRFALFTLLLVFSLSGCTGLSKFNSPIQYYHWITLASMQDREEEKSRLESEQENSASSIPAIQLAMLFSVPESATAEQLELAREFLSNTSPETPDTTIGGRELQYRQFGAIWLSYLQSQESNRITASESAAYQNRIQSQTVKIEELEQQLEALTTIEQRMVEREQGQNQE